MNQSQLKVIGGSLLVAGTSIGAGMLALPISTGLGGFGPAICMFLLCWLFSNLSGFLLLEICMKMPNRANLVSMSEHYLGKVGKFAAWVLYLFLFYCLSIAYISAGGAFVQSLSTDTVWLGSAFFTFFLGTFVFLGAKYVDRINFWLMLGLIASYISFLVFGLEFVDVSKLSHASWPLATLALPVIFTSFSFQGIIPSLTHYLKRDPSSVRLSILLGTSIAFLVYVLWELLILGIVPVEGSHGLKQILTDGGMVADSIRNYTGNTTLLRFEKYFAFFAIATSFLGVNLGLFDFLSDGLKISKTGANKVWLAIITFVPPLFIAISNPNIFLVALGYAGGIGAALLLGLIPILMVWASRYSRKEKKFQQLAGGKIMLLFLAVFVFLNVAIQLFF